MSAVFLPIALIAYIVGVFLTSVSGRHGWALTRAAAAVIFVVGWLAHVAAVVAAGLEAGRVPLDNRAEFLLVLGLAVMTLYLLLRFVWEITAAGFVLPPLAALAGFSALTSWTGASAEIGSPQPGWLLLHTTISTLGLATLIVALAMSVIYLFQDRALKTQRTLRLLERLPPLDRCDRIGLQALLVGFILFSVGILTGAIVNESVYQRFWVPGFKQTVPLLAWLVFAALLVARFKLGFRGRKSAYLTITGVTLGLLTILGLTL